jgi:hypothetical protein
MTDPRALAEVERLRRRACDAAQRRLADARGAAAELERRRRGWRSRLDAEARDAADPAALARWLEGCRRRERALAGEAARLAAAVAEAERDHRAARLGLEQIEALRANARARARRAALAREQRRLDDLAPRCGR